MHEHQCGDDIDRLYYTACPNDILCIHCGGIENNMENEDGVYPICSACINKGKCTKEDPTTKSEFLKCFHAGQFISVSQWSFNF